MASQSIYEQVGGFDAILALCKRWHSLCLADPLAGHPFEHDLHPKHCERLAAYLSEAWGGPPLYTAGYGDESYVQSIHACNGVHIELDEACLSLFERAVSEMPVSAEAKANMNSYFRRATEEMRRFESNEAEVPKGLPFNYA